VIWRPDAVGALIFFAQDSLSQVSLRTSPGRGIVLKSPQELAALHVRESKTGPVHLVCCGSRGMPFFERANQPSTTLPTTVGVECEGRSRRFPAFDSAAPLAGDRPFSDSTTHIPTDDGIIAAVPGVERDESIAVVGL